MRNKSHMLAPSGSLRRSMEDRYRPSYGDFVTVPKQKNVKQKRKAQRLARRKNRR